MEVKTADATNVSMGGAGLSRGSEAKVEKEATSASSAEEGKHVTMAGQQADSLNVRREKTVAARFTGLNGTSEDCGWVLKRKQHTRGGVHLLCSNQKRSARQREWARNGWEPTSLYEYSHHPYVRPSLLTLQ